MPRIVPVNAETLAEAAELIARGELVAFPTETVYGLGANALDEDAVARIFAAKGRPAWNPVIVHVASTAEAARLTTDWSERAERAASAFWPGPVTLVLPKSESVPPIVTAGGETVGVRMPNHADALALIRAAGVPIAAPSANRFTELSPTTAEHVAAGMGDRVSLILDGGACAVGIESTVLDVTSPRLAVLRPGVLSAEALATTLGEPVSSGPVATTEIARSPGQADRHYAPRATLWIVGAADVAEANRAAARAVDERHEVVGLLALSPSLSITKAAHTIVLPNEADGFARGLYAALHALDAIGCTTVFVEEPPIGPGWTAVHDRLRRAVHA